MYKAFRLKLNEFSYSSVGIDDGAKYLSLGRSLMLKNKRNVDSSIRKYLSPEGVLQASEIEDDWFPAVDADVFISHSHKDEPWVLAFAGYLLSLGLKPFVDFTIWGYADDLIKKIDDRYFLHNGTYDYDGCNYAASQVYLFLNSALQKMIDNTGCVIFMDTPNSLKVSKESLGKTGSVWIYSELLMTNLVEKRKPRSVTATFHLDEAAHEEFQIEYCTDLSHLGDLTMADFERAVRYGKSGTKILDFLYGTLPRKVIRAQ